MVENPAAFVEQAGLSIWGIKPELQVRIIDQLVSARTELADSIIQHFCSEQICMKDRHDSWQPSPTVDAAKNAIAKLPRVPVKNSSSQQQLFELILRSMAERKGTAGYDERVARQHLMLFDPAIVLKARPILLHMQEHRTSFNVDELKKFPPLDFSQCEQGFLSVVEKELDRDGMMPGLFFSIAALVPPYMLRRLNPELIKATLIGKNTARAALCAEALTQFDHDTDTVFPVILEFIQQGHEPPWLSNLLESHAGRYAKYIPVLEKIYQNKSNSVETIRLSGIALALIGNAPEELDTSITDAWFAVTGIPEKISTRHMTIPIEEHSLREQIESEEKQLNAWHRINSKSPKERLFHRPGIDKLNSTYAACAKELRERSSLQNYSNANLQPLIEARNLVHSLPALDDNKEAEHTLDDAASALLGAARIYYRRNSQNDADIRAISLDIKNGKIVGSAKICRHTRGEFKGSDHHELVDFELEIAKAREGQYRVVGQLGPDLYPWPQSNEQSCTEEIVQLKAALKLSKLLSNDPSQISSLLNTGFTRLTPWEQAVLTNTALYSINAPLSEKHREPVNLAWDKEHVFRCIWHLAVASDQGSGKLQCDEGKVLYINHGLSLTIATTHSSQPSVPPFEVHFNGQFSEATLHYLKQGQRKDITSE